jgi:hypothetical protein
MEANLGRLERIGRVVVGAVLVAAGFLLIKGVIGGLVCLVGAVLIFSGSVGFCHVYKFFGVGPSRKS